MKDLEREDADPEELHVYVLDTEYPGECGWWDHDWGSRCGAAEIDPWHVLCLNCLDRGFLWARVDRGHNQPDIYWPCTDCPTGDEMKEFL